MSTTDFYDLKPSSLGVSPTPMITFTVPISLLLGLPCWVGRSNFSSKVCEAAAPAADLMMSFQPALAASYSLGSIAHCVTKPVDPMQEDMPKKTPAQTPQRMPLPTTWVVDNRRRTTPINAAMAA